MLHSSVLYADDAVLTSDFGDDVQVCFETNNRDLNRLKSWAENDLSFNPTETKYMVRSSTDKPHPDLKNKWSWAWTSSFVSTSGTDHQRSKELENPNQQCYHKDKQKDGTDVEPERRSSSIYCRSSTESSSRSFIPASVRTWNNLDRPIWELDSLMA